MKVKYVIVLESKHTGESIHLGADYPTQDAAQAYADSQVCSRCNRVSIYPVPQEAIWLGKREGFRVRA